MGQTERGDYETMRVTPPNESTLSSRRHEVLRCALTRGSKKREAAKPASHDSSRLSAPAACWAARPADVALDESEL